MLIIALIIDFFEYMYFSTILFTEFIFKLKKQNCVMKSV